MRPQPHVQTAEGLIYLVACCPAWIIPVLVSKKMICFRDVKKTYVETKFHQDPEGRPSFDNTRGSLPEWVGQNTNLDLLFSSKLVSHKVTKVHELKTYFRKSTAQTKPASCPTSNTAQGRHLKGQGVVTMDGNPKCIVWLI